MLNQFSRTELIFGRDKMQKVYQSRVAVFGIGGVGGYVVEALARSGVGTIDVIDDDKVCLTNINRQLYATFKTVGQYKVDLAEERCKEINPKINVVKHRTFYMPETKDEFDFSQYDYVVDCIDTVTGKLQLVEQAKESKTPIISCMGAGNKTDPSQFKVSDIYKTSVDPLARVMRYELRKRKIRKLKVVYSTEKPIRPDDDLEISCRTHCICPPGTQRTCLVRRDIPGSNAFVPPAAGLLIASEVVKDLLAKEEKNTDGLS
ncbi:MAG: tRNA threonylcarbamoyladenosine dehydratase [Erysipelotrichaceae bacterium]|nr:tRNA threonylcarbamoyladenosine dehydratase [Erysipelotrichaceae bacterium]